MINFRKKLIPFLLVALFSFLLLFPSSAKIFAIGLNTDNFTIVAVEGGGGNINLPSGSTVENLGGNVNLPASSTTVLTKEMNPPKNTGSVEQKIEATRTACNVDLLDPLKALKCFILDIFSAIAGAATTISGAVLNNIIDGKMTGLGFSPSDNFVIEIGWGIVRNIANAALIIGLVWIAISIILGREGDAKKTLINFIIIALLINFTPVICSFIIDGSNIITNSFMSGGVAENTYSVGIFNAFNSIKTSDADFLIQVTYSIILLAFSLLFSVILLLYSFLFIARTIILWILVIVSPIAFATKVFPKFEHIGKIFPSILSWNEWWGSFWQWCFVGIPAGLSIYLANKLLVAYSADTSSQASALTTFDAGNILGFLFAYILPFAFLLVGFFMSISAGEKAASKLSGEVTGYGKKFFGAASRAAVGFAGGAAAAGSGYASRRGGAGDSPQRPDPGYTSSNRPTGQESLDLIENRPIPGSPNPAIDRPQQYNRRTTAYDRYTENELNPEPISTPSNSSPATSNPTPSTPKKESESSDFISDWKKGSKAAQEKGLIGNIANIGGKTAGMAMGTVAGIVKGDMGAGAKQGWKDGTVGTAANISGSIASIVLGKKAGDATKTVINAVGGAARDAGIGAAKTVFGDMTPKIMEKPKKKEEKEKDEKKAKIEKDYLEKLKDKGAIKDGADVD